MESWLKSNFITFRISMPDNDYLISGNSLVFRATILILCLFVSIHGNMDKQRKTTVPGSVMPPLCHLPYKFYSLCSCLFLLLLCSALLRLGLGFIQHCGRGWPQSQWHFGKAQQGPEWWVFTGTLVRWHRAILPNVKSEHYCYPTSRRDKCVNVEANERCVNIKMNMW